MRLALRFAAASASAGAAAFILLLGADGSARAAEQWNFYMHQSAPNFVSVNANVVAVDELCAAAIDVELFRWSNEYRASVSVWTQGALIIGGRNGFNSRVREKVETMTRDFTADWLKARQ